MQLKHTKVPLEFLNSMPKGIKYINRNGKDYLVIEKVTCANGHDLMAQRVQIHGEPSICLKVKIGESEGYIFLCSFWGSHHKLYNFIPDLSDDTPVIVSVSCPKCGVDMLTERSCSNKDCNGDQAIELHLDPENHIFACASLNCPEHELQVVSLPLQVSQQLSNINFFGQHDDDMFGGI